MSRSDPAAVAVEVRELLVDGFGAQPRQSWGLDALYHRGRLFVMFDDDQMIGKFPPDLRDRMRRGGTRRECLHG